MLFQRSNVDLHGKLAGVAFVAIILALLWQVDLARAAGSTYYVAKNGNDGNRGTQSQPLKTIQKAVDLAQAGDTIYVRGGTYNEDVRIVKSGTSGKPIRLHAYPGEKPVIDGQYNLPAGNAVGCSDVAPKHCFIYTPLVLLKGSHLEFKGFKVIRSYGRGIGVTSVPGSLSKNILIDSCIVDQTRNAGINVLGASNVTIQNCEVTNGANYATHSRSASVLNWPVIVNVVGSQNVTIRNNKIYENWGEGIAAGRDSKGVVIEDNVIYDNYALQIYVHRAQNVTVQRNLVYHTNASAFRRGGNPSSCIAVNNEPNFTGSLLTKNVKIRNNVTVGCSQGVAIWGNGRSNLLTQDIEISHNTVANTMKNTGTAVGILVNHKANVKNILVKNNIVLRSDGFSAYLPANNNVNISGNILSIAHKGTYRGSGNTVADPLLKDPNRSLQPGSVQINWFKPKNNSPALAMGAGPYEYYNGSSGGSTPSNPPAPEPTPDPTPTEPAPPTSGSGSPAPEVLYKFNEGGGSTVRDVSNNGDRINLSISDTGAVNWSSNGLTVKRSVMIRSQGSTNPLTSACRSTNAISLSAWITPANVNQDGPARIVSFSNDPNNRNFTLGQGLWGSKPKNVFNMRLRTNQSDNNGEPSLTSSRGAVTNSKTHVVYTRNSNGTARMYVNGAQVGSRTVNGTFNNWQDSYTLLLANEASGDRPWLGTYHQVAIYCHSLTSANVQSLWNTAAGAGADGTLRAFEPTADSEVGTQLTDRVANGNDAQSASQVDQLLTKEQFSQWEESDASPEGEDWLDDLQSDNGAPASQPNLLPSIYMPFVGS